MEVVANGSALPCPRIAWKTPPWRIPALAKSTKSCCSQWTRLSAIRSLLAWSSFSLLNPSSSRAMLSWSWLEFSGTTCCFTSSATPKKCTTWPTSSSVTWRFPTCWCVLPACPLPWRMLLTLAGGFLEDLCATWCSSFSRWRCTCRFSHWQLLGWTGEWCMWLSVVTFDCD